MQLVDQPPLYCGVAIEPPPPCSATVSGMTVLTSARYLPPSSLKYLSSYLGHLPIYPAI